MIFDIEMIKSVYAEIAEKVEKARQIVGRPLSLTEKILYSHIDSNIKLESFQRGMSYVDFRPDRVAMQDATARWLYCNLCKQENRKLLFPQPYIVII